MEMKIDIKRIKAERGKRAWSQDHLAEAAGLGLRTVHRIEKTGSASLESIKALAAVFELSIEELCILENGPVAITADVGFAPAALWATVLYAFLAAMNFGAMVLDIVYARLVQAGAGGELIFVEVADSLLSLGLLALLVGAVAVVLTWDIRPVRNLLVVSIAFSILVPLLLVPFMDVIQESSGPGAVFRLLFGIIKVVLVFAGLWKLLQWNRALPATTVHD